MSKKTKSIRLRRDATPIASVYRRPGPSRSATLPESSKIPAYGRRRIPAIFDPQPVSIPADRRVYNPEPEHTRPARRFSGRPARLVADPSPTPSRVQKGRPAALFAPAVVAFKAPAHVAVCARRGVRKEVIHANGVAGTKVRKPRRGPFTGVKC